MSNDDLFQPRVGAVSSIPHLLFGPTGSADDWPDFLAAAANASSRGVPLVMLPGEYVAGTVGELPSNFTLIGNPGVRIRQTLTPNAGANPLVAAFSASEGEVLSQTALAANAAAGAITISTDATMPVGAILRLNRAAAGASFHAATRVVRSVAGSGPYTLTLDEPLYEPFLEDDGVSRLASVPTNIRILGNGMHISGTGERYVEIAGGYRCHVENIVADTEDGVAGGAGNLFAFDVGSRECSFERITIDGGNGAIVGIAIESANRCHVIECHVERVTEKGIAVIDSCGCTVQRCSVWKAGAVGIIIGGEVNNTVGCFGCVVRDCRAWNQTSYGVQVSTGSATTQVDGCDARFNGVAGIQIAGDSTTCQGTSIVGGEYSSNTSFGVRNGAGGDSTRVANVVATANGVSALYSADEIWVSGFTCPSHSGTDPVVDINTGRAYLRGLDVACTLASHLVVGRAGTIVELSGSRCTGGATTNGVRYFGSGVVRDTFVTGCALGVVVDGTMRVHNVDAAGCTTPFFENGGKFSRGTVTLNGATPVDYTFADIRAADSVTLTRKTAGGTPGPAPTFVITAGSKVAVTGTASDTSVYAIEIN